MPRDSMSYLDFKREAREETTSWQRANPRKALVERTDAVTFRVMLQDGDSSHTVQYTRERGAYCGYCDCKGWDYRDREDSPCAHLCVLRKAEFIGASDTNGLPIYAQDSATVVDPSATEVEPDTRPVTDGGETVAAPPAGSDGRQFGRPEERL